MEYADGGSLDQKIRLYQNRGQKFETEEILRYMAQITLGVMAMHSRTFFIETSKHKIFSSLRTTF